MSIEKYFCPSPWIHLRLTRNGDIELCRWGDYYNNKPRAFNLSEIDFNDFFSNNQDIKDFRKHLLSGEQHPLCNKCYQMEEHSKISGRERQLLKVGITKSNFHKQLISSPFNKKFTESFNNNGSTDLYPVDWQIDLGNYCNGACTFCDVESSSKLLTEFKKIGLVDKTYKVASWTDNESLVEKFVNYISVLSNLRYLHFIGGEPLVIPAFKKILKSLVGSKNSKEITIGFTTNLMSWDHELIELFKHFKQINVGVSVETLSELNDYVRYPSKIEVVYENLKKWTLAAKENKWLCQVRITPTCLTIHDLIPIYNYALNNMLTVESCNFLQKPEFMRPSVLPLEYREKIIKNIKSWILENNSDFPPNKIVNTRNPSTSKEQLLQDAQSYVNYLSEINDESYRLPDLIKYLKKLETSRNNSILKYLPEYEKLFRSAGY